MSAALAWSGLALTAQERYLVDRKSGTVEVQRQSLLGRRATQLGVQDFRTVRLALGGPDDDRWVVELVNDTQDVVLRLPQRINTLSDGDQVHIGRMLAEHLSLPLESVAGRLGT